MTLEDASRESDWSAWRVTVAGIGIAGYSAADALMQLGAHVTVVDAGDGDKQRERAEILQALGATVLLGHDDTLPPSDLLVVSPGLPPAHPIIKAASASGVPVWGELELAWRVRRSNNPAPWLCITGTNGKTTATMMLESMLRAAGLRATAAGNIGSSLVDVCMHDDLDFVAVEVGAPQLPFVYSMSPLASVCLNIAPDHIDHFGSMEQYIAVKSRIYERTQVAAVYNDADPVTLRMVEEADVIDGCRGIGFTLGVPAVGMLGVVDDVLVDRAFIPDRTNAAQELAVVGDVQPQAPHNIANALAAAALARAAGVPASAVRDGLRSFTPAAHRIARVGEAAGVVYVDDSKATNTHAAQTSLQAYNHVIWIAGGMAKGQDFDDLVRLNRDRMRAAVLLGVDRAVIAEALARHAPDVPVVEVPTAQTGAMAEVVAHCARLAQKGDTVLLAPGCASWDMFRDYGDRGRQFAEAVAQLEGFTP